MLTTLRALFLDFAKFVQRVGEGNPALRRKTDQPRLGLGSVDRECHTIALRAYFTADRTHPGPPLAAKGGSRGTRRVGSLHGAQQRLEELAGVGAFAGGDGLRRSFDDQFAAALAAVGAEVDHPVGALDDV